MNVDLPAAAMSHAQSIYTIKTVCVFLLPCFKEVSRLKLMLLYCIQKEKILLFRHNAALKVSRWPPYITQSHLVRV